MTARQKRTGGPWLVLVLAVMAGEAGAVGEAPDGLQSQAEGTSSSYPYADRFTRAIELLMSTNVDGVAPVRRGLSGGWIASVPFGREASPTNEPEEAAAPVSAPEEAIIAFGEMFPTRLSLLPQPEPAAVVTNEPARDPFVDALAILKRIDPVHAAMRRGQTASLVAMLSLPEEVDAAGAESRAQEVRTRRLLEQSQAWMNEGRHDEAIGLVENALERAASSRTRFSLLQCLASYNFQIRRYAEALRHMQAIDRISPGRLSTQCSLAGILMSMDRHDEALEILTKITLADIRDRTLMFAVCFNLACTHSLKGNRQRAMEYLVVAFKTDPLATMASLGDPQLDNIRDEVLFKELSMKRSSLDFSEEIAPSSFTLGTQDAPTNDVLDVALVLEQLRLQQRVTSGHSGPIELRGLSLRGEGGASEPGSRLGL